MTAAPSSTKNAFKVEYMQPFLDSLKGLFDGHLGHPITIGKPEIKQDAHPSFEMTAVISFSGTVLGRAVISMPNDVAEALAKDYLKMDPLPDGIVPDALGELANVIIGRAKSDFEGQDITISPPTVVQGQSYTIAMQRGAVCLTIPCNCKHGDLALELSIIENS